RLLPPGGRPVYALSNHDISRTVSRLGGEEQARLAAVMLLTLRGTPFLYYGEEIGLPDLPEASGFDSEGRDRCRTPMRWDGSPGAGFTTGRPWLPVGDAAGHVDVEAASGDPESMLSLSRGLIWLREGSAAPELGR